MSLFLLDNSLQVQVFYEAMDSEFEDNICVRFVEICPEDEKVFRAGETNLYLTAAQARQLAFALENAAVESRSEATKQR